MGKLETLQAGRAIAALAVVGYHVGIASEAFSQSRAPQIENLLSVGYLGVDFFFVLSGFIIYWTSFGKEPSWLWVASYTRSRFVRVYAPYLPVGLALAIAYIALPGLSASSREWSWLPTLTLLPSGHSAALSVAWTLQHEVIFYAIFGLFFTLRQVWFGMALWMLAIAFMPQIPIFSATINVEFLFGMAAAELSRRNYPIRPAALYLLLLVAGGTFILTEIRELFGLAMAAVLVLFVRVEIRNNVHVGSRLTFLGSASYSIYLVHVPAISLVARITASLDPRVMILIGIVASLCAGCAYHLLVERNIMAAVTRILHFAGHRQRRYVPVENVNVPLTEAAGIALGVMKIEPSVSKRRTPNAVPDDTITNV